MVLLFFISIQSSGVNLYALEPTLHYEEEDDEDDEDDDYLTDGEYLVSNTLHLFLYSFLMCMQYLTVLMLQQ